MQPPNIVMLVDDALSADVVDRIGEAAGASRHSHGLAVEAAVPGVFHALGARAKDPAGAAEIVGAIRETSPAASLNDPAIVLEADAAVLDATAERVLGPERGPLTARVAEHSGCGEACADAFVRMVTPLALGALARTVSVPLGQETLLRLFREQQGAIDRADPFKAQAAGAMVDTRRGERRRWNTIWALVIGVVLLAVLVFALRACGGTGSDELRTETTLQPSSASAELGPAGVAPGAPAAAPDTLVSSPPAEPAQGPG